jgi:hypothetical protein
MIKIVTTDTYKYLTAEGDWKVAEWKDLIELDNNVKIKTKSEIQSYIELQDKVIVLTGFTTIDSYHRDAEIQQKIGYKYVDTLDEHTSVYGGNIFCYSKEDGKLLWQVESKEDSPYVDIGIGILNEGCEDLDEMDDNKYTFIEETKEGGIEVTTYIDKPFRAGKDNLGTCTFSCHGYNIDIDTGKVTFVYQGK